MVTDNQVRMFMKLIKTVAARAGMSENTARKYRKSGKLPSQCKVVHNEYHRIHRWQTTEPIGLEKLIDGADHSVCR